MKRLAVIAAAILTATALSIAPAAAHATLQSSNPAENSVLDAAPDEVTLTFNQAVQSNFATVTVVGSDGTQWGASDPVVDGSTVTVDLDGLGAAGEYTIGYRVVSADGHPITGSIPFQLTQASPTSAATSASAAPATTETTPTAAEDTEDSSGFPIWIIAVVVIAVGAAGVLFALRKRSN
ncbi:MULTISPECIES: copper resistance protein CopC [unclassified Rhodococcus (in: high G+C Gram-positive bacteria)]|uniref:copper resistance CopC family protein n=1 Tax=unclassified Rhodococcus (in: high G+C Gram-positive bacteria) TaxID=192944 RepID=UPI002954EA35|nr:MULTISPECIES: copper resistance protein CopC [unclassified Rhodococcus (in: high G+C Gram-positive bacteria)]MDV7991191.1 copper resistance protein CopC [Rhodococcus sp. IEGM 1374]MDV8055937.1 copper resistance protein CopC [Rhodococcus sp. IEGM 1343]